MLRRFLLNNVQCTHTHAYAKTHRHTHTHRRTNSHAAHPHTHTEQTHADTLNTDGTHTSKHVHTHIDNTYTHLGSRLARIEQRIQEITINIVIDIFPLAPKLLVRFYSLANSMS